MRIHFTGRSVARLLVATALCALPSTGGAQVVNPTSLEFAPSVDHNATASDGTPIVSGYDLGFYLQGAGSPFQISSLGKPAPAGDGLVHVNLSTVTLPSPGIVYESRVVAVGPGGSGTSTASNTFMFAVPCTYAVSPLSWSLTAAAWTGSESVTAGTGCTWTTMSSASWLSVTAGASGSGGGTVSIAAAANAGTSSRTGTFTIAGQTVTVTQAGQACAYAVSPTSLSAAAAGGTVTVTVTAQAGCSWTASSGAAWAAITGGATGSGNGTVTITASANGTTASRTATLTIAGQSVTVSQAAPATCGYTVTPTSQSFVSGGGSGSVSVSSSAGCAWSSSNPASWITITAGASGSGAGTLSYTVAPNTATTSRSATLTVAGQPVSISQAAAAPTCSFSVTPTSYAAPAAGGSSTVGVTAGSGCVWTATSGAAWITITAGGGATGSGTMSYTVVANALTSPRTGTLTVAGQSVTVTQAAAACGFAVSPTSHSAAAGGGSMLGSVTTTSNCSWTASSPASWLTVSAGTTGTGDYTLTASPNTSTSPRTATVTVAGTGVTVTQAAGSACSVAISPASQTVADNGSTSAVVNVTAASGCAWTATSNASWLVLTGGLSGTGNGTVSFRADRNTASAQRTATITIGGQIATIVQTASGAPKPPKRVWVASTQ